MPQRRRLAALIVTLVTLCSVTRTSCEIGDPPEVLTIPDQHNLARSCVYCNLTEHHVLKQTEPPETELEELPTPEKGPPGRKGEYLEQDFFWFNDIDGKQQWEDPSSAQFDDDGNEFYIDPETKQKTSQRPEVEAWISLYDEERERNYYLNELTNVTTWEVPYLFAWRKVFVDENNSVVESPEDEWDDEGWIEGDEEYDSEAEGEDEQPMTEEELAEMEAMYAEQGIYTQEDAEHAEL